MQHIPGWVVGALGTAAIVGSFYAGGALIDRPEAAPLYAADTPAAAAPADAGLQVECEPGQRAVVRQATALDAGSVACVSAAPVTARRAAARTTTYREVAPVQATRVNYVPSGSYAPPAVIDEPIEVYQPRAIPVTYQERDVARPTRSVKKSVAIIAGSTAVAATIGGLTKGKKGALIGGLLGGGAATVWDQVTRRRDNDR